MVIANLFISKSKRVLKAKLEKTAFEIINKKRIYSDNNVRYSQFSVQSSISKCINLIKKRIDMKPVYIFTANFQHFQATKMCEIRAAPSIYANFRVQIIIQPLKIVIIPEIGSQSRELHLFDIAPPKSTSL